MIPRSLRVPGMIMVGAALFAAVVPNMVRASAKPAGPAAHISLPAHLNLAHSRLVARNHGKVAHAHAVRPRTAFHNLLVTDPNSLRVVWPQSIAVQTTTQSNFKWQINTFSNNGGQVVGDLGALDQYSEQSPFVKFHDVVYTQSGARSALMQNAVFTLGTVGNGNGMNPYYFQTAWLGTVFNTPAQALARVTDAFHHFQNTYGVTMTDCSANNDGSCYIVGFDGGGDVGASGKYYIYVVFAIDNVSGEFVVSASDSDIASDGGADLFLAAADAVSAVTIDQVAKADSNTCPVSQADACPAPPTSTPTSSGNPPPPPQNTNTPVPTATPRPTNTPVPQPQVKLDSIALATEGKDKKLHSAKSLKSAQAGYFIAQIEVTNQGSNTPAVQITYSYKGKPIATDQMKQVPSTLDAHSLFHLRPNQVAQTLAYYDVFGLKKVKKAVTLQATVDAAVGSAHDSGSINFPVKTNCTTKKGKKTCK